MLDRVTEDVQTLDPVAYIRHVGLLPEDSYGFIPTKLGEGSELLYLYRDRPEYERARSKPAMPHVEMQLPTVPGGRLGEIVEQAQEMQRMYGAGQPQSLGAPGDPMPSMPDVEKLVEAAKLRSTGAIDDAEYARLRADAGAPDPGAAPAGRAEPADPASGPAIVAHRMYPGIRARSSTKQLDEFLPSYCEALELRPEDVYGVFRGSRARARAGSTVPAPRSGTTSGSCIATALRTPPPERRTRARWTRRAGGRRRSSRQGWGRLRNRAQRAAR